MHVRSGAPREGTKLREAYDRLRQGETLRMSSFFGSASHAGSARMKLRDFYGLELKGVSGSSGDRGTYCVGEWDGPYFVPIERIIQSED